MELWRNVYLSQTLPWLKITSVSKAPPVHEQMRYCLTTGNRWYWVLHSRETVHKLRIKELSWFNIFLTVVQLTSFVHLQWSQGLVITASHLFMDLSSGVATNFVEIEDWGKRNCQWCASFLLAQNNLEFLLLLNTRNSGML